MTRADFLKFAMAGAAAQAAVDAAVPVQQTVISPRPHGNVIAWNMGRQYEGWCQCDDCEDWDEYLETSVRESVARLLPAFWQAVRDEYRLKGSIPHCGDGDEAAEALFAAVRYWVEDEAGVKEEEGERRG